MHILIELPIHHCKMNSFELLAWKRKGKLLCAYYGILDVIAGLLQIKMAKQAHQMRNVQVTEKV